MGASNVSDINLEDFPMIGFSDGMLTEFDQKYRARYLDFWEFQGDPRVGSQPPRGMVTVHPLAQRVHSNLNDFVTPVLVEFRRRGFGGRGAHTEFPYDSKKRFGRTL